VTVPSMAPSFLPSPDREKEECTFGWRRNPSTSILPNARLLAKSVRVALFSSRREKQPVPSLFRLFHFEMKCVIEYLTVRRT
jgi:hypothetical protein